MIKAANNRQFEKLFHLYNKQLISKNFHGLYQLKNSVPPPKNGAIIMVNHSSWWDPLMLFYLNHTLWHTDAVAMMDEAGLLRFPFFSKLGAFSVNSRSPRSVKYALDYASSRLREGKNVFLFPQGNEYPLEKRPLSFFGGAGYLKWRVPTAPVVPVVFYHGLFHEQRPEWFVHSALPLEGAPSWNRKRWTLEAEKIMTLELEFLKQAVLEGSSFNPLLQGKIGFAQRWENTKRYLGVIK
jgi:1-acyl-sn-glycerol-3-phosphate acyltransferase